MTAQSRPSRLVQRGWRGWQGWPGWRTDVAVALLAALFQIGGTYLASRHQVHSHRPLDAVGYTLLAIRPAALIARRRHHAGPAPGGGNGIRGMRERAEALGGQLAAENRPGGGFRVEAMLPLDGTGPEGGIDPASDTPDAAGEQREEAAERGVPW